MVLFDQLLFVLLVYDSVLLWLQCVYFGEDQGSLCMCLVLFGLDVGCSLWLLYVFSGGEWLKVVLVVLLYVEYLLQLLLLDEFGNYFDLFLLVVLEYMFNQYFGMLIVVLYDFDLFDVLYLIYWFDVGDYGWVLYVC